MSEANGTRKNRKNNLSEAKGIGGGISFFNPSPERTIFILLRHFLHNSILYIRDKDLAQSSILHLRASKLFQSLF